MPAILMLFEESNIEAASVLDFELRKAFAGEAERVEVILAFNEEAAKSRLPGNVTLLITPLNIRPTAAGALSLDDERAVDLLQWMSFNGMNIPSIVILPTPVYTEKLLRAQPLLGKFVGIPSGKDIVQEVVRTATEFIHNAPVKCLDIEIEVQSRTEWGYRLVGKGFPYDPTSRELAIEEPLLEDVSLLSDTLASADDWQPVLRSIGSKLMQMMSKNSTFVWDVSRGLQQAGGEANTRVRFIVKPELHKLALEAVICPHLQNRHWMLEAPVYRRLQIDGTTTGESLFERPQKLNCLIIDAGVTGWIDELKLFLEPLPSVRKESDWLEEFFSQQKERFNIGEVVLLRTEPGKRPLSERVKEELERREWAIVHYCGHSHFDKTKTGYVFFPREPEGTIEKTDLKRFSDWLRRVTFTYFSSCDSGAGPFVFALAERRVSNILGFRWPINDALAFEHTKAFYSHLFEKRSLERAFLKARQQMHEFHPDDRIWAAPILLKQLGEG